MRILWTLLIASMLTFAGCLDDSDDAGLDDEDRDDAPGDGDGGGDKTGNETGSVRSFEGSAVSPNPASGAFCVGGGLDGEQHDLDEDFGGWEFALEPDTFEAYWMDDNGTIEEGSGMATGTVPAGATSVEVCATTEPGDYVLTVSVPGEASNEPDGNTTTA